jgi:enoyl-CoA hydratase/carnithine racemase
MDIQYSKQAGVATLAFNRVDKKNAITSAMYQSLADGMQDAALDPAVRVIIITGQPGIFTAGNDVEDFLKNPPAGDNSPVAQFMMHLHTAEKPVIAAVTGLAIGIGTTLLMHCDLVYAADNARLAMPFTQLGLCPEFASSILLPRLAGYQQAAEKLLLGEAFTADEAQQLGLVNKVLPADQLQAHVTAQAAKLAALPAASVRATKRLMKAEMVAPINAAMKAEMADFGRMLLGPEAREAFSAFVQKRKPDFSQFA